jgi:dienelactone hydrolase
MSTGPGPDPDSGSDPAAIGLAALDRLTAGDFARVHAMFAPSLRAMVSPEVLHQAWSAEQGKHGTLTAVGTPVVDPEGSGGALVRIPVTFSDGAVTVLVSLTASRWVTGVQLGPAAAAEPAQPWQPPDYADPAAFEEETLTLGSGPLAVPAALCVPRRPAGPLPGVVLLAGSGPQDRDETLGRNKPFKDLAWGLATLGVVTLRFDKVTFAHPRELAAVTGFTMVDEYATPVEDALLLLRGHPRVSADSLFLLGHSLGGTVAPRLASRTPSVAGLILLAGGAQPMHRAAVRQVRYLLGLAPEDAGLAHALEALTRQAEAVDAPDLSASNPSQDLPFGVPAPYWLDVRSYDPARAAAELDRPMLLLQGGRDYQVTVDDDLARWRAALAHRHDVTIRVLDADNHLFFSGSGPSTPTEYEPAQHVDPAVVSEIAKWVAGIAVR